MRVKEYKALARQTLIGRYGTLIVAEILSVLLVLLALAGAFAGIIAALYFSNASPAVVKILTDLSVKFPWLSISGGISALEGAAAGPVNMPLAVAGVIVFTVFLFIAVIFMIWFRIGMRKLMLGICRGDQCGVGTIFYAFSADAHPVRVILTSIAKFLIHNLIGLVAVAVMFGGNYYKSKAAPEVQGTAGIVTTVLIVLVALIQLNVDLGMTFAELSIIDRPSTRIGAALRHSREVTKGKKLKLIWMILFSFIFWYLLMCICRLTALWIIPYIRCAYTMMYLDGDGSIWQVPANRPSYNRPAAAVPAAADTGTGIETRPEAGPAVEEAAAVPEEKTAEPISEESAETAVEDTAHASYETEPAEAPAAACPVTEETAYDPVPEETVPADEEIAEAVAAEETAPAAEEITEISAPEETIPAAEEAVETAVTEEVIPAAEEALEAAAAEDVLPAAEEADIAVDRTDMGPEA